MSDIVERIQLGDNSLAAAEVIAEIVRLRELIIEWDAARTAWRAGAGTRNMDVWHENCDRWDAAERALTEQARRGC